MSNPLHAPLRQSQQSSYTSLAGAVGQASSSLVLPLPQTIYSPSSKWDQATSRRPDHAPIAFDYKGYSNQGVRMQDLLVRDCSGIITGGADQIFGNSKLTKITFRIMVSRSTIQSCLGHALIHSSFLVERLHFRMGQTDRRRVLRSYLSSQARTSCGAELCSVHGGA